MPRFHRSIAGVSLPPGPRSPSVVQLVQFTQRAIPWMTECGRRFGDPFTCRFPGLGTYVLVTAPELVKQIFTEDADVLLAGKANALIEPFVGRSSVLLLDGPPHLRQRRLLSPPLRGERMQAYASIMERAATGEIARMPVGRPFSMHAHMQSITLDVILRAVFGLDGDPRTRELRALLVALLEPPPAIFSFIPVRYLDFPGSPYRVYVARRDAVDRVLRAIIRERVAAPPGVTGGDDILSLLVAARDLDGAPMTEDELRDELMTMLVAGHETTATALSWAIACVLEHPEVHARLRAGGSSDEYVDAVIKETLRLRPILPDVVRQTQRPYQLAGYEIPAGVNLTPCIYLAHHRAETWGDPEAFRPERFLGAKIDPYAWFPFGGGIRRCLGMAFALFEMRVVLRALFAQAELRLAERGPVKTVRRMITLAPQHGTRVVMSA
jgi:cytochrome P450